MPDSGLHIVREDAQVRIEGDLDLSHYQQASKMLEKAGSAIQAVDMSGITRLDTAGAHLLNAMAGKNIRLIHPRPEHKALLELVANAQPAPAPAHKTLPAWKQLTIRLGKAAIRSGRDSAELVAFTGQSCVMLCKALPHPHRLRLPSIAHHIEAIGINAIPIISLIAFVISVVIAYQGQIQLKSLGAEQYTVNLIAISVLREMGVLLTAIMIAGRSGSAFAAEIGTMKVREEVDALRSIGLNPFELLVLPRLIALLVSLPLLALLADIMGLFGGALICLLLLNISIPEYFEHARTAANWHDFFVGMVKAPVFALVIAIVGCRHGLKVSGSSESVGRETTASVVESIFLVLALDGMFSVYFQKVGL